LAAVHRLKTRAQFQSVLSGSIVAKTPHFALHRNVLTVKANASFSDKLVDNQGLLHQDMWVGAMVPKRWAKRAVTRNAIKRQIYTVSLDFSRQYPQAALVVRLRSSYARTEFASAVSDQLKQAVRAEVQALMRAGASAG
jgi:ribonuclease P protein component